MYNQGYQQTILKELRRSLLKQEMLSHWIMLYLNRHMSLRLNVPKISGQDTSVFWNWPKRMQSWRKCLHIEVDQTGAVIYCQQLMKEAKDGDRDLNVPIWGNNVRLSNMAMKI